MKPLIFTTLLLVAARAYAGAPANYYQSTAGLSGAELRAELHQLVKAAHTPLEYSPTRAAIEICDQDPANSNHVILIYTRRSEPRTNFVKSPPQNSTEWNREHLWPNSRGILGEGADYADLFNLRAADVTVNADRENFAFEETDVTSGYTVPGSPEAPQTSRDANSWEPPPAVKGDIARSLFYMDLRYDGDGPLELNLALTDNMALVTGSAPYMGRLTTLLLWHFADPVSPEEMLRNDTVQQRQGNRNPFIDNPGWVTALFGDPMAIQSEITGNQVKLSWWSGLESASLETSTNPASAPWTPVSGTVTVTGNFRSLTTSVIPPRRYYRVRYRGIESP